MLSVAPTPDQYSSNGCYNCTGPEARIVQLHPTSSQDGNNICSMQISYSEIVFCVNTLTALHIK